MGNRAYVGVPSTVDSQGASYWESLANSKVADGAEAQWGQGQTGGSQTEPLYFSGFDFSKMPDRLRITGVLCEAKWRFELGGNGLVHSQDAGSVDQLDGFQFGQEGGKQSGAPANPLVLYPLDLYLDTPLESHWYSAGGDGEMFGQAWTPGDFLDGSFLYWVQSYTGAGVGGAIHNWLDGVRITVFGWLDEDDMDTYFAGSNNGFKSLGGETVAVGAASAALFPNPPSDTCLVRFTVRTTPITVRCDGVAATAGAHGNDYGLGGPYEIVLATAELGNVTAIRDGGSDASVWAEYFAIN